GCFKEPVKIDVPREDYEPFLVEDPGYTAGLTHVPVTLGENAPDIGDGTVSVIRHNLDENSHPSGTIAFVGGLLVVYPFHPAGALFDRALYVVLGHILALCLVNGCSETGIGSGVAPSQLGSYRYLLDYLCKYLAALCICRAFFVFDCAPFIMSGHLPNSLF